MDIMDPAISDAEDTSSLDSETTVEEDWNANGAEALWVRPHHRFDLASSHVLTFVFSSKVS